MTFSYSLSDPTQAPGFAYYEDEVTSPTPVEAYGPFDDDPAEIGSPRICYCGSTAIIEAVRTGTNEGRLHYTCRRREDSECSHVWKWWDRAVMEELKMVKKDVKEVKRIRKETSRIVRNDIENKIDEFVALQDLVELQSIELAALKKMMMKLCVCIAAVSIVNLSLNRISVQSKTD